MDSAPSEHRDTAAHLAPLEARLGSLESQMASIVTTIEDRLAAALQTVFDRIPGMIVAQMPQLSFSTRRPKLKRVSRFSSIAASFPGGRGRRAVKQFNCDLGSEHRIEQWSPYGPLCSPGGPPNV
ncbi:hypothetical protein MTO96_045114 [Rhipicephalus appendiculatus]